MASWLPFSNEVLKKKVYKGRGKLVGEAHRIPSGFSVRMGGQVRWESPEQSSSQEERSRKEPTRDADKMNIVIFLSPLIRQSNVLFPFSSHVITTVEEVQSDGQSYTAHENPNCASLGTSGSRGTAPRPCPTWTNTSYNTWASEPRCFWSCETKHKNQAKWAGEQAVRGQGSLCRWYLSI